MRSAGIDKKARRTGGHHQEDTTDATDDRRRAHLDTVLCESVQKNMIACGGVYVLRQITCTQACGALTVCHCIVVPVLQ